MKNLRLFILVLLLFPGFLAAQDADAQATSEREARRERIQSHEAKIKSIIDDAKNKKEAMELFRKEFSFESRVYYLEWITPDTARNFIERELKSYHLAKNARNFSIAEFGEYSVVPGDRLEAAREKIPEGFRGDSFVDKVQERATAISNMNAVLVEARPETLKAVEELLKKVDETVQRETKRQGISLSQIEVVLLKAEELNEASSASEASTSRMPRTSPIDPSVALEIDKLLGQAGFTFTVAELDAHGLAIVLPPLADPLPKTLKHEDSGKHLDSSQLHGLNEALQNEGLLLKLEEQAKPSGMAPGESALTAESLAKTYGVSKEDLELFKVKHARVIGRSVLGLMPVKGEGGKATAGLGGLNSKNYTVELEYIEERDPYLVLRIKLESTGPTGPNAVATSTLLTSTVFLEDNRKGMLLGLTNLNDTLLLIVRRSGGAAKE